MSDYVEKNGYRLSQLMLEELARIAIKLAKERECKR